MDEPNNMNNDYFTNMHQSEDVNFFGNTPIHQYTTQDFSPSVASLSLSDNVDEMPIIMNSTGYEDRDYTGDYASCQDNPSVSHFHSGNVDTVNGQLNSPNFDQAEIHTNSSCPPPVSFQTFYGSSNLYSDTTVNDDPTDNHFGMMNGLTTASYIFTQDPTGTGYVVTKVEHTQLGRMSAADFNQMLATIRM